MIIHKINFPFYGICILLSLIIGCIYIYKNLVKQSIQKKYILYYFIMFIPFALIIGLTYTFVVGLISGKGIVMGLSSYGGLLGVVIASIIFELILPSNKQFIKYSVLSLPLIYGLSKIGCTIAGCCYGIPYSGIFAVKYIDVLDEFVFPIQALEVILNVILFFIFNKFKNNKNIVYITFIVTSMVKFLTDYLRYEHINKFITSNQIFSIILIILTIICYLFMNKHKDIRHKN